jgi:hypothetical protein
VKDFLVGSRGKINNVIGHVELHKPTLYFD